MQTFQSKFVLLCLIPISLAWPLAAVACDVPVFRYALERWEPDPYVFVVFHRQPLAAEQEVLVKALETTSQDGLANLAVVKVNVSEKMSEAMQALWNTQGNPALPCLAVRYPPQLRIDQSVWTGPLNAENVRLLLDSPARREIFRRLAKAETSVWLLLEGGDKKQDDEVAQMLEKESKRLEKELVLPEQSPMDPEINPNLPLRIAFSILRLARSNPAERMLANMLLNCDSNLAAATGPMLFPIFGRGRALPPAMGEEIRAESLEAMAGFLTGACSCQVKEMNPGYDLLLAANWNAALEGGDLKDVELPPVIGQAQISSAATSKPQDPPSTPGKLSASAAPAVTPAVLAVTGPAPAKPDNLVRNLFFVLGGGVVVLAVAVFALKGATRKSQP
jgi:hypothetical protein